MRNINFNESSVLGEFARIMDQKGLVKKADASLPAPEIKTENLGQQHANFEYYLDQFPNTKLIFNGKMPSGGDAFVALLNELDSPAFKVFSKFSKSPNVEEVQKWTTLKTKLIPVLKQLQNLATKREDLKEAYLPKIQDAMGLLSQASNENGTMKTADQTLPAPTINTQNVSGKGTFEDQLRSFPQVAGVYAGQKIKDGSALLNELNSMEFRRFKDGWAKSNSAVDMQKLQKLMGKLIPVLQGIQKQVMRMDKTFQDAYLPQIQEAMGLLSHASLKNAGDKHYDVSGETGEDLIENAHGRGMKTELTHSKTPDALVENVVEQQKADIAVVNKMPKGTYATLVGLYNKLNKMGLKDHLGELRETIRSVATIEDIVEHTLITLADELDVLGFTVQANLVDELLKTAELPTAQQAKNTLLEVLQGAFVSKEEQHVKQELINMISKLDTSSLDKFMLGAVAVGQFADNTNSNIGKAISSEIAKASKSFYNMKKNEPQQHATRSKKVLDFQVGFNAKSSPESEKLVEDGILGPKTKAALDLVGGWAGWEKMKNSSPVAGREELNPKPSEEHVIDFPTVFRKLLRAFDIKFHNAEYTKAPAINDYLTQEAKKIVDQYNKTSNATMGFIDTWVNQSIAGLTQEDVAEAVRG